MWHRGRERTRDPFDLELEVGTNDAVRVDHFCAGAEMHRLLGADLMEPERARLRAGGRVAIVVQCDRCIWERRLVLRCSKTHGCTSTTSDG